jgi:hypothetical protein
MSELFVFTDPYQMENVVNGKIRRFLQSHGYPEAVVSRDLQTDNPPAIMVWSRQISPAVEIMEGFQSEGFQISVSCKGVNGKNDRQMSSEVCTLIRAFLQSYDFVTLPITNIDAGSGAYPTDGLEGWTRAAYTFTMSVYQTANKLTV